MKWIASLLLIAGLVSCSIYQKETPDGYAHLRVLPAVKPKPNDELPLRYRLYSLSDTLGICYFEIDPAHYLLKRDSLEAWFCQAQFQLTLKKGTLSKDILFQAQKTFTFRDKQPISDSLVFKMPAGTDLWYDVRVTDLNKYSYRQALNWWLRPESIQPEHFLLLEASRQRPFVTHFSPGPTLHLRSDHFHNSSLQARIYHGLDTPAAAPFAWGNNFADFSEPDTTYLVSFTGNALDIEVGQGYVLLNPPGNDKFTAGFFAYPTAAFENYLQCMAYFCTQDEITALSDSTTARAAYEDFWLRAADQDTVKKHLLQREYMHRVDAANAAYSSYKPGSLTDRGMIHSVFGAPDRVQQEGFHEIWMYNDIALNEVDFLFFQDRDQQAPNHFYLERGIQYKNPYYISVENWRTGVVELTFE
jgi:GWxTD domain-containing protein